MNLTQRHQWPELALINGAEFAQKNLAIALDIGFGIFGRDSEVQRGTAIKTRDAAGPSGKAVKQPGQPGEIAAAENFNRGLGCGHVSILAEGCQRGHQNSPPHSVG